MTVQNDPECFKMFRMLGARQKFRNALRRWGEGKSSGFTIEDREIQGSDRKFQVIGNYVIFCYAIFECTRRAFSEIFQDVLASSIIVGVV